MKLVIGGCSFSDWYPGVEKPWSVKLSERMKLEYLHEARGCGSNYRIWRELTKYIVRGRVSKEDIILIQYTTPNRYEFWSNHEHPIIPITNYRNNSDPFYDRNGKRSGSVIRYKFDAHSWVKGKNEKAFFTLLENDFIHDDFCSEQFAMYQNMFHGFLLSHGFNKFFYLYPYPTTIDPIWAGNDRIIFTRKDYESQQPSLVTSNLGHLNDLGTEVVANLVYERIKDRI